MKLQPYNKWRPDRVEWAGGTGIGRLYYKALTLYMPKGNLIKPGDWIRVNDFAFRVLDAARSRNGEPKLKLERIRKR